MRGSKRRVFAVMTTAVLALAVVTAALAGSTSTAGGKAEGGYLVAIDTVDAGVGETVLIVSGSSARMAAGLKDCPVDAAVVGIVDAVELNE